MNAPPLPPLAECRFDEDNNQFVFLEDERSRACTQVILSRPGKSRARASRTGSSSSRASAGSSGSTSSRALDGRAGRPARRRAALRRRARARPEVAHRVAAPRPAAPRDLGRCSGTRSSQSVADLASLRMRSAARTGLGKLPGAGIPWFMTVFGRDTIITCLQTLLFGPELARHRARGARRPPGDDDDRSIDAEPGKIVHEVRPGKAARGVAPHLLRHRRRDAALPHPALRGLALDGRREPSCESLREPALRALEWIERTATSTATASSSTCGGRSPGIRQPVVEGLGRLPAVRRRHGSPSRRSPPVEVQGYVYDAKRGPRSSRARSGATGARRPARARRRTELYERFNEAFWDDERGGYYVLGLDREKHQVDSLCSNVGHLLWSGIVPPERVDAVVDQLMGEGLWSGWGVRTMSTMEGGFNPLSYHNGTVWPHDNSLIAWGLARYGRWPEAQRIVRQMLDAARHFDYQLPEVFAGFAADRDAVPDRLSDRRAAAGLGGRNPGAPAPALLRPQPDRKPEHARLGGAAEELPSWAGPCASRACAHSTAPGTSAGGRTGRGARRATKASGDRDREPALVPGAADGLRRDRVGRGAARGRARGRRPRRHALRVRRLADEGEAEPSTSGAERVDRPLVLGAPPRAPCYERADEFDVINDHSGLPGAALGGAVSTPVVHTVHGPLDGEPGELYEARRARRARRRT